MSASRSRLHSRRHPSVMVYFGGLRHSPPTGGVAYGIPLNAKMSSASGGGPPIVAVFKVIFRTRASINVTTCRSRAAVKSRILYGLSSNPAKTGAAQEIRHGALHEDIMRLAGRHHTKNENEQGYWE
jgi:hypothetical protein